MYALCWTDEQPQNNRLSTNQTTKAFSKGSYITSLTLWKKRMEIKLNDETITKNLHYSILQVDCKYYYITIVLCKNWKKCFIFYSRFCCCFHLNNLKYLLLKQLPAFSSTLTFRLFRPCPIYYIWQTLCWSWTLIFQVIMLTPFTDGQMVPSSSLCFAMGDKMCDTDSVCHDLLVFAHILSTVVLSFIVDSGSLWQ